MMRAVNAWCDKHMGSVVLSLAMAMPVAGGAIALSNDTNEYPLCWDTGETINCADPSGYGITINGTRYYSCKEDLDDEDPCFTYRVRLSDETLWYTLHKKADVS